MEIDMKQLSATLEILDALGYLKKGVLKNKSKEKDTKKKSVLGYVTGTVPVTCTKGADGKLVFEATSEEHKKLFTPRELPESVVLSAKNGEIEGEQMRPNEYIRKAGVQIPDGKLLKVRANGMLYNVGENFLVAFEEYNNKN